VLTTSTVADLAKAQSALLALGKTAQQKSVHRAATAALIAAENNPAKSWSAAKDDGEKQNVTEALPAITDPALRAQFQPLLSAILASAQSSPSLRAAALRALPLMGADNAKANFTVLAGALREGKDRAVASRAIMQLPRESWDKAAAAPLAENILAWAKTVPPNQRNEQSYIETAQLGTELAGFLPPADATRIRKDFAALGSA
jgi:hypothetical protein